MGAQATNGFGFVHTAMPPKAMTSAVMEDQRRQSQTVPCCWVPSDAASRDLLNSFDDYLHARRKKALHELYYGRPPVSVHARSLQPPRSSRGSDIPTSPSASSVASVPKFEGRHQLPRLEQARPSSMPR